MNVKGKNARQASLGAFKARYRGRQVNWRDWIFFFLPVSLVVIIPLGYGIWLTGYGYQHYGSAAALSWPRPWYLAATVFLSLAVILIAIRLSTAKKYVRVFENGLQLHLNPFDNRVLFWTEMSGITVAATKANIIGAHERTDFCSTLLPNLGKPVRLTSQIVRLPALIEHIKAYLYPQLWKAYTASFDANQWIHFGSLAISNQSIRINKLLIPWDQVVSMRVQSGFLVIELKDASNRRLEVAHIPNLELLLQLVEWAFNHEN